VGDAADLAAGPEDEATEDAGHAAADADDERTE
jgi:hypothetical protein